MKYVLIYAFAIVITSCNTEPKSVSQSSPTDSLINSSGGIADSAYAKGARLVAASDCLTCHQLDKKSFGPSYYAISSKYHFYEGTVENLAYSIIHGSKGLWGGNAMTPHPNTTYQDAKAMASYILSLKNTTPAHPNAQ